MLHRHLMGGDDGTATRWNLDDPAIDDWPIVARYRSDDECYWVIRRRPEDYKGAIASDVAEHACPPGWDDEEDWWRVAIVDDEVEGPTWAINDRVAFLFAITYWPCLPLTEWAVKQTVMTLAREPESIGMLAMDSILVRELRSCHRTRRPGARSLGTRSRLGRGQHGPTATRRR